MADGQLLERFLQRHDHAAFEHLVQAHGPMVYGVCQRILMNHHDAEEVFQATFLVLARKAKSLTGRASLAGWLHEAAQRTALNARRLRAQRRVREQAVPTVPESAAKSWDQWPEIAPLLDQELSRLPEKYRVPILLCDLEGKSQDAAAAELGCSRGTLSSRLVRARALLQQRLSRLGVTVSIGSLAVMLSQQAASANLPAGLLVSTVQMATVWTTSSAAAAGIISPQVAALTEGVLKSMFLSTMKTVAAALTVIALAGLGAGGLMYQMSAAEPAAKPQKVEDVLEKLRGDWKAVGVEEKGKAAPAERVNAKQPRMAFTDREFRMTSFNGNEDVTMQAALKIDVTKRPFEIDLSDLTDTVGETSLEGMEIIGIFKFEGERLKLRIRGNVDSKNNPIQRPTKFDTTKDRAADDGLVDITWTLERVQP